MHTVLVLDVETIIAAIFLGLLLICWGVASVRDRMARKAAKRKREEE